MDHCRIVEDINDSYRMAHENAITSRVRDILVQLPIFDPTQDTRHRDSDTCSGDSINPYDALTLGVPQSSTTKVRVSHAIAGRIRLQ